MNVIEYMRLLSTRMWQGTGKVAHWLSMVLIETHVSSVIDAELKLVAAYPANIYTQKTCYWFAYFYNGTYNYVTILAETDVEIVVHLVTLIAFFYSNHKVHIQKKLNVHNAMLLSLPNTTLN